MTSSKGPLVFCFPRFSSWISKKKMSRKYITAPFTPYQFEDELASDLEKDDAEILEKRYRDKKAKTEESSSSSSKVPGESSKTTKSIKSQTQWTRSLDVVQEHFSSHVILDGVSQKIPPQIYALKHSAKRDWILYKKRECERRKRIREKIKREKTNEQHGKPANVLLAMVDSCESCRRLYVTVNLFWGVTLCDSCYFNPEIINGYMSSRLESAEHKVKISSENIVEEVMRFRGEAASKSPPPPSKKRKRKIASPPLPPEENTPSSSSSNNSSFFCVTPFKPPPKEDAMVFNERPIPPPPTSPGEPPGNELEKMEVAEGIMKCDDDPYFEDIRSPSPIPELPPSPSPAPPPAFRTLYDQTDFKQLFIDAGENSNTVIGTTPNNSYSSSSTIFAPIIEEEEEKDELGIDDEDYHKYLEYDYDLSQRSQGCWF